jgi:hypothetical protein
MTVSQGFVRLQDVLIDLAGRFDAATGPSQSFGQSLATLAQLLENLQGSRILRWLGDLNMPTSVSNLANDASILGLELVRLN